MWSDIRRLYVYKRDIYVGNLLCLAILATEDRLFEINEESPGWKEVADAIEHFLPGSLSHTEWELRLISTNPSDPVVIYPISRIG
ncbi:MAG: hypothetical protein PHD01_18545 [Geobacteraceae bacterium]|nr:hypothetical protein [Geobacteraceae bacterium]